ncbi:hypothetical protein ACLI4J_11430, partial [Pseudomonas aeruginosa]
VCSLLFLIDSLTGVAIAGERLAHLCCGTADAAGELAGHIKQPRRLWLLWPKGAPLPAS